MFQVTFKTFKRCALILTALVASPSQAQEGVYHDNVVIVLDTSGSMNQAMQGTNKMEAAKVALKEVLNQIPETTHVGLLTFGSGDPGQNWIYPLGPRDDETLVHAIDRLRPTGGTPLGAYVKIGGDRLLERRRTQLGYGTYRLLVVTDGEAQDQNLVDAYSPEVMARGITLDVIGVSMRQDHTLARIAHSYRRADDPDSLTQAIAEVFAEVSGDDDSSTSEEAFELLAAIPVEVAGAMVKTLATSGNEPIGGQFQVAQSRPAQPPRSAQQRQPPPSTTKADNGGFGQIWLYIFVLVVVFSIFSKAKRAGRRRR